MKCKNCNKEMELENHQQDYCATGDICIRQEFWCAICNVTCVVNTWYTKIDEEIIYNE